MDNNGRRRVGASSVDALEGVEAWTPCKKGVWASTSCWAIRPRSRLCRPVGLVRKYWELAPSLSAGGVDVSPGSPAVDGAASVSAGGVGVGSLSSVGGAVLAGGVSTVGRKE
eukprot:5047467-Amphidinium_carterae.1